MIMSAVSTKLKLAKIASASRRYLTNDEELAIVQLCHVLVSIGIHVLKQEGFKMIDKYIHIKEDERK
jgi:hypothetical protein